MKQRIVVIDGHPDGSDARFVHALATAYQEAATHAGHQVCVLKLADMDFAQLRSNEDFQRGQAPDVIRRAQQQIRWRTHLALFHPLWLGAMPAQLKAFFEQVMRPDFAFAAAGAGKFPKQLLAGKSAICSHDACFLEGTRNAAGHRDAPVFATRTSAWNGVCQMNTMHLSFKRSCGERST